MVEFFLASLTWPAMAVTARRTVAKVKSAAMRPRQPEVPNLMGDEDEVDGDGVMARYSSAEGEEKNSWGEAVGVWWRGGGGCGRAAREHIRCKTDARRERSWGENERRRRTSIYSGSMTKTEKARGVVT